MTIDGSWVSAAFCRFNGLYHAACRTIDNLEFGIGGQSVKLVPTNSHYSSSKVGAFPKWLVTVCCMLIGRSNICQTVMTNCFSHFEGVTCDACRISYWRLQVVVWGGSVGAWEREAWEVGGGTWDSRFFNITLISSRVKDVASGNWRQLRISRFE